MKNMTYEFYVKAQKNLDNGEWVNFNSCQFREFKAYTVTTNLDYLVNKSNTGLLSVKYK